MGAVLMEKLMKCDPVASVMMKRKVRASSAGKAGPSVDSGSTRPALKATLNEVCYNCTEGPQASWAKQQGRTENTGFAFEIYQRPCICCLGS